MTRKIAILITTLLMLGSTSCKTAQPRANYLFLPSKEEISMADVAHQVSKAVGIKITPDDDVSLYAFIADWLSTPYRYGQASIKGTDCSGFIYNLFQDVYNINVGRTSAAGLQSQTQPITKKSLKEGDLVFFNINNRTGGSASHVGVYLRHGLFAHAAVHSGVTISSLSEPYYKRHYLGSGRILK